MKNMVVLNTDIQIEEKSEFALPFDPPFDIEEVALKVCTQVLSQENFTDDAEVSLVVTDAEEVHRLNREFRGIDRTTDVLSFPGLEFEEPADFSLIDDSCINPDNDCVMLGDIVINAQKVKEQAEFSFLVAHSMLHLCGYDHMTPEEADVMEARQEMALQALGITRE